jgi:hypothetical protein
MRRGESMGPDAEIPSTAITRELRRLDDTDRSVRGDVMDELGP